MRVALLVRSLEKGGAERQLVNLAVGLKEEKDVEVSVLTFYENGALKNELIDAGVPVVSLEKRGRWDLVFVARFVRAVRKNRYDLVHSFLDGPNVLVAMLRPFLKHARVAWSVRSSYMDWSRYHSLAHLVYGLSRRLSRVPHLVVFNSGAGRAYHQSRGYSAANSVVVYNGIDVDRYRPMPSAGAATREAWGKGRDVVLVGLVARLDPMKDHETFLKAAHLLRKENAKVQFVCVGSGSTEYRSALVQLAADLGLSEHLLWVEDGTNMASVYNALDIATLSSYGEGFPNVIAEAMACGVPCVATDVGDCAELIGDTGEVVEARNPESLKRGWQRMIARIDKDPDDLARAARARIVNRFGVSKMVADTCSHYRRVLRRA